MKLLFVRDDDDTPSTFESELASMLDSVENEFEETVVEKGEVS